jgi:hypothetical protein
MIYATFHDLIVGYFENHLKGKPSYSRQVAVAKH